MIHRVISVSQGNKALSIIAKLVLLSVPGLVVISTPSLIAASVPRLLTPSEMQSDYDLMRRMLEEVHPGLYRYSTRAYMNEAFNAGRARLNRSLTPEQFWGVAAETIAQIHCGHTKISLDDRSNAMMANARKFPLRVVLQRRRIVVLFNDTPYDRTILPGMEITSINGHRTAHILNRIEPTVPGDGFIETGKLHEIGNLFAQYYWLLFEQSGVFTISVIDDSGKRKIVHLSGVTDAERKANQNPVNAAIMKSIGRLRVWSPDNLSMRLLPETDAAEIHIGHFVGENFSIWLENTFETLQEKHTKTLVLDLRGNGGGEDKDVSAFLSFLADKPFRFLDHVDVKTTAPSFQDQLGWSSDFAGILKQRTVANPQGGYLLTSQMLPGLLTNHLEIILFTVNSSFSSTVELSPALLICLRCSTI